MKTIRDLIKEVDNVSINKMMDKFAFFNEQSARIAALGLFDILRAQDNDENTTVVSYMYHPFFEEDVVVYSTINDDDYHAALYYEETEWGSIAVGETFDSMMPAEIICVLVSDYLKYGVSSLARNQLKEGLEDLLDGDNSNESPSVSPDKMN